MHLGVDFDILIRGLFVFPVFLQPIIDQDASYRATEASEKSNQKGSFYSKVGECYRCNQNVQNLSDFRQNKYNSSIFPHPRRSHTSLDHIKYLGSNAFENSAYHQQLKVKGFVLAGKKTDEQLTKTKCDGPAPQKFICYFFVEEAHGDDEEDRECTGYGVQEIEGSDVYFEDFLQLFLHALGLVEHEIMPKHHENQKNSQLQSAHSNYKYKSRSKVDYLKQLLLQGKPSQLSSTVWIIHKIGEDNQSKLTTR